MVGRQYWDHWDKFGMRPVLKALRSEAGEQMVLQDNFFIEKVLPGASMYAIPFTASRWRLAQSKPSVEPQSWMTKVTCSRTFRASSRASR
jgi:hypothetical protein